MMALVVIQAGHYRRTSGATGTAGLDADPTEQQFTITAANACARALNAAGHVGRVIRADVPDDAYRGDAFVAIHCDGSTSSAARGASVGYRTPEGQRFGAAWKAAYHRAGWSGGWRPDNYTANLAGYYGTKRAVAVGNRAAFVAEAGFLTNPADEALLSLPAGPERFARALVSAVNDVFGAGAREAPPQEEDDMPLSDTDIDRVKAAVRGVLNEGTGEGTKTWAETSKSTLAVGQATFNHAKATRATLNRLTADAIAAKVVAKLPANGDIDQATVEAGVRAVLADALDSDD